MVRTTLLTLAALMPLAVPSAAHAAAPCAVTADGRVIVGVPDVSHPALVCGRPAGANANAGVDCGAHDPLVDHVVVGADGATTLSNTNVDGVEGTLYVPDWTTQNLRGQKETAADVVLNVEDSQHRYFQLGWYISAGGTSLDATETPKVFFGEGSYDDIPHESLTTLRGVPLPPGYHTFRIIHVASTDPAFDRHFDAYVDGAPVWTSRQATTSESTPSVVGESNWRCADLWLWAVSPAGGPALYGHHVNGGWSAWSEHRDFNDMEPRSCWTVDRYYTVGATATGWDEC